LGIPDRNRSETLAGGAVAIGGCSDNRIMARLPTAVAAVLSIKKVVPPSSLLVIAQRHGGVD